MFAQEEQGAGMTVERSTTTQHHHEDGTTGSGTPGWESVHLADECGNQHHRDNKLRHEYHCCGHHHDIGGYDNYNRGYDLDNKYNGIYGSPQKSPYKQSEIFVKQEDPGLQAHYC
ncbi:GL23367 [Drosophila persimilis]|uniref:GL23367 n=1 Tax=Drosophila persimilis TaxID=7234 RepID=B4G4E7_DROPE|nr:GL23367 [Drosophila persimilis]